MVIVKIWGGLGNQLFQYSFGKYLAATLGTQVKYDIQITNSLSSFVQRDLALSHFNISIDVATKEEVNSKKYFSNIQLARLERKLAQQFPSLFSRLMVEQNIPVPLADIRFKDDCYYEGYWQSYHYLTAIEQQLLKEITLKETPSQQVEAFSAKIKQAPSASIHVRRTDYITHQHFITCDMEYYEKAIRHIKQAAAGVRFFVFSDDIAWCKENFIGEEFFFVEGNKHYEDLCLMANCKYNIIANSTFSWWGGWLNSDPNKIVVTPAQWHTKKDGANSQLLPGGWIKK